MAVEEVKIRELQLSSSKLVTERWAEMAGEVFSLRSSLSVPNVLALAASGDLAVIPGKYIRPEMEEELICDDDAEKIPVVDLGGLFGGDLQSRGEEAARLRSACEDWGFFQLVNHGVPAELIERMKAVMNEFFDQPLEEKMASSKQPPGIMDGYGQLFVVSEQQKLDWADLLYLVAQPPALRKLSLWPAYPSNFRYFFEDEP